MRTVLRVAVATALAAGLSFAAVSPAPAGSTEFLTITKAIGENPPASANFVINVSCVGDSESFPNVNTNLNFTIAGGSQNVTMPVGGYEGVCTITETTTAGATPTYACVADQPSAATCGGGGASPSTVDVNDPSSGVIATITVTNDFAGVTPVIATPTTTG